MSRLGNPPAPRTRADWTSRRARRRLALVQRIWPADEEHGVAVRVVTRSGIDEASCLYVADHRVCLIVGVLERPITRHLEVLNAKALHHVRDESCSILL